MAAQARASLRPGELRPGELRPGELRPGELRPGELRPGELRPAEPRSGEPRPMELRLAELRPAEPRTAEPRSVELRTAELRTGWDRGGSRSRWSRSRWSCGRWSCGRWSCGRWDRDHDRGRLTLPLQGDAEFPKGRSEQLGSQPRFDPFEHLRPDLAAAIVLIEERQRVPRRLGRPPREHLDRTEEAFLVATAAREGVQPDLADVGISLGPGSPRNGIRCHKGQGNISSRIRRTRRAPCSVRCSGS